MNAAQRKYALERVTQIEGARVAALRDRMTTPAKSISKEERVRLVVSGKVKVRKDLTQWPYHTDDAFDFSQYSWDKKVSPDFDDEAAKIKERASSVRDMIMLGDAAEALRLLNDFAGANA